MRTSVSGGPCAVREHAQEVAIGQIRQGSREPLEAGC